LASREDLVSFTDGRLPRHQGSRQDVAAGGEPAGGAALEGDPGASAAREDRVAAVAEGGDGGLVVGGLA
jgi:hypothetical protein